MVSSRYFFKTTCTPDINKEQYVFRELTMDDELVPLYDGKIFVQLDRISWNACVSLSDQFIIIVFSICILFLSPPGLFHWVREPVFSSMVTVVCFCLWNARNTNLIRYRTIVNQTIFSIVSLMDGGWRVSVHSSLDDKDLFYFKQYHSQESTNRFCLQKYIGEVSIIWWQKEYSNTRKREKERTDHDQRESWEEGQLIRRYKLFLTRRRKRVREEKNVNKREEKGQKESGGAFSLDQKRSLLVIHRISRPLGRDTEWGEQVRKRENQYTLTKRRKREKFH